ncbi:1-phosphatidylinositol 4,5-bisphosphate phosphodiesterase eta-2 [Ochotona princeps]|uniref:1-phosphatidylinositol 4,5-bisphosphate phosphodiesterase eta-2 n=1 Tax=Ochotona princeps TaxID=9978 RepID=UPI0027149580|nr:1-phosphatidylinositol 4,5-bisphosphate phosphodiesterase eta-2 [Ochotona princeps]
MAPPQAGPRPGPAALLKDPGSQPELDRLLLNANVLLGVERCMRAMQEGTQLVKLRGSSKGLVRVYHLDEHRSCIRWRPSRKNEKAKISIDSIQEVSEGRQSEIFQRHPDGAFDPSCCFSIYHGGQRESLDLVSASGEEARLWVTGLRFLLAGIRDEDSLARRQRTRDQWLKQTFAEADKNGDGSLSVAEVLQLLHKLNVNLPRRRVKQMFREADTDEHQGTLGFEEFCAFYKMMSTRRDLYLLLLSYSNHKEHMDAADLQRFLEVEQKMVGVTLESCRDIIEQFEPCPENRRRGVLGIDGFTNYARSPAGDIFNPEHHGVHQDMTRPLSHYFITSSHNTYLVGDQLMSQSRVDMYAWVLQAGCRCVEVDCWDGPDGEPIVHHGYTLTSKILFKDVVETINKYAFIKNEYPVILSIENHCSVAQQRKMAQYLTDILGDKLDLSSVSGEEVTVLPSPQMLKGKVLVKGKKLPASIGEDAEEGEVSDEDSADDMEEDCKLLDGDASTNRKRVENMAKRKLDSLIKESKIRDCEDPDGFSVSTMLAKAEAKAQGKAEEDAEVEEDGRAGRQSARLLGSSFSWYKKRGSKKVASVEEGNSDLDSAGSQSRGTTRQKKTMKLSRALSDLVKYTKSVGAHDVEVQVASSWQVSSFSETKAQQILQQKPAQYLRFNQRQLSRVYPSSYRVDSSNFNPQPFWNAGCQMVALNYQSEGRMLQLNRAKFSANGNCGYVLKPPCMCQGVFNPNSEDPLPGRLKKQLALRIISGQQLPKPRDSVLGDRGEIIDPFVEVEVIGLPVDCNKEQTRVVDDNGFNPLWEETLVFTVHMPEIALVRFLVWDHDPIGRDFIGQRTLAFSSLMPGYRHVYLEGMEEASIFVHVAVSDISGKVKQALGLKGLFLRGPKPGSLDSHAAARLPTRPSVSQRLLRRTASAPTKTQKPCRDSPELVLGAQDVGAQQVDNAAAPNPSPTLEGAAHQGPAGGGGCPPDALPVRTPSSTCPPCSLEPIQEEPTLPATSCAVPSQKGPWRPPAAAVPLRSGGQGGLEQTPREPCPSQRPGGAGESEGRGRSQALGQRPPVRRTRSDGQVTSESLAGPSTAPAVYLDATGTDRLWQRLEPGSHRDSMSSASSVSSGDTVIDLALSSLGPWPCPTSAARLGPPPVTKSKSNPNLWAAGPQGRAELRSRPPALLGWQECPAAAKSKSLGDLTADDFAHPSEGSRDLGPAQGACRVSGQGPQRDPFMEQLRWLTGYQGGAPAAPTGPVTGGQGFLRRSSSRSQSRVRAIASRARQAQQRQQRLQDSGWKGPPEEERGTPEGACSVSLRGCVDALTLTPGADGLLLLRL